MPLPADHEASDVSVPPAAQGQEVLAEGGVAVGLESVVQRAQVELGPADHESAAAAIPVVVPIPMIGAQRGGSEENHRHSRKQAQKSSKTNRDGSQSPHGILLDSNDRHHDREI